MMNWLRLLGVFPLIVFLLFVVPYILILIFLFAAMLTPLYLVEWTVELYRKAVKS